MKSSIAAVERLLPALDAETFDADVFRKTGVFVVRNAIPQHVVQAWQQEWASFYEARLREGRDVNKANPVSLSEDLPELLATMYREPALLNVAKQVFGEHVALFNHRFVIKDQFSRGKVFLHQDSCYHVGHHNKASFFVPLSHTNRDNGGMTFHVGSHRLGVLGDAGEINRDAFDFQWPTVTPGLAPGDFVFMHSSLWHESGPNESGVDRILADTIVQPADDPTGKELLSGEWQTDIFISPSNFIQYFVNSRVLRLIKYEKERA